MGIFNLVWQPLKYAFGASLISAGIEAQTGLRPATHLLGDQYSQATVAETILDAGRITLRFGSEVAVHSGYWDKTGGGGAKGLPSK